MALSLRCWRKTGALDVAGLGTAACCPGSRREHKWWCRKPLLAAFAKLVSALGVEPSDIRAGRADAERERLPPLVEARELDRGLEVSVVLSPKP